MPSRAQERCLRLALLFYFLIGLSPFLIAQQTASDKLRAATQKVQAGIDLLEKSRSKFSSTNDKELLDALDKQIAAGKASLAKLNDATKEAASLEGEIKELSSLKENYNSQGDGQFPAILDKKIRERRTRLEKLASAASSQGIGQPAQGDSESDPPDETARAEETPQESSADGQGGGGSNETASKDKSGLPSVDSVNVPTTVITGNAAKDSEVKITADGKAIGKVKADKNGNFTLSTVKVRDQDSIVAADSVGASKPVKASAAKDCEKDNLQYDCRSTFEATFYTGLSIDTFAADEFSKYHNFEDASKPKERLVGGFDFAYRIRGDPKRTVDKESSWPKKTQVWVYGETVHGVRSKDVDCSVAQNKTLPSCDFITTTGANPGGDLLFILRNATSLEAFTGVHWEFLPLNKTTSAPASLYVGTEYGFLSVN